MFLSIRTHRTATVTALASLMLALAVHLAAQQTPEVQPDATIEKALASVPLGEPAISPLALPEDRGQSALEQDLRRLGTTASAMMIVAHPDDEDGPLLTYLSRGLGVRTVLFTLTRGEGGQNAMSAESDGALGVIRTNELLKADEYYGTKQLWGTEVDFGFSKTQEEAFAQWGHERVLYDAVLAVRRERPQVIVATFIGGITDGHGQHQVSGEIAQEVFKAAGDPKVFPEQLKDGLEPWQPLAVYSMVPFAPIEHGQMFDYATGKSEPAKFKNYVTGELSTEPPAADATMPVGNWDYVLGRSYVQIARQGWGEQKSQNGGGNPVLSGPATTSYHLWAVAPSAEAKPGTGKPEGGLFHNERVSIDTSLSGLAHLDSEHPSAWVADDLRQIDYGWKRFLAQRAGASGPAAAHKLAPVYRQVLMLRTRVSNSDLDAKFKAGLLLELDAKIEQFQAALGAMLGLDLTAFTARSATLPAGGPFRGASADEMPPSVQPGEEFNVRVHTAVGEGSDAHLNRVWLESRSGSAWKVETAGGTAQQADQVFKVRAADDAEPTRPYFTRPNDTQPYYNLIHPQWRGDSFAPYPLSAWAEFTFDGMPLRLGQVVQTMHRVLGPGGIYEPLAITPAVGVRMEPKARILPLDGGPLPVKVTIHTEAAAEGTVELKLPDGWHAEPAQASFHTAGAADTEPMVFSVTPDHAQTGAYAIQAVATAGGRAYQSGWQSVGYAGLRPYNVYEQAELKTRKLDARLAPGLRVGYVMGTGDRVPEAIEGLGAPVHLLTPGELTTGDLSVRTTIVVGIRAYSARPELAAAEPRLEQFVRNGGTLVVQYQSGNFAAPLPLTMGRFPERVVDEQAPVKLLDPADPLLRWPNAITSADFEGWVEERGHSFMNTWDAGYKALTETADPGQDPQRGGLLVAHVGKGTYIYVSYAIYRQLPELVPGAYRLLANLLSAGRQP